MKKYFYSPVNIELNKNIDERSIIKFSFCDDDYPHFSKTGEGIINKINSDNVEIVIDKKQDFFDTTCIGNNIDLNSGLLLNSLYEDDNIVIFKIPHNYIWSVKKS